VLLEVHPYIAVGVSACALGVNYDHSPEWWKGLGEEN
jgi:hypothetical protein